jgi:hypothetical protein
MVRMMNHWSWHAMERAPRRLLAAMARAHGTASCIPMYPCNQGLPGAARQRTVRCVHVQQQPGNGLPYEEHAHAHAGCSRIHHVCSQRRSCVAI